MAVWWKFLRRKTAKSQKNNSNSAPQPGAPKRETVTVTVDTRSVDVNLDKFNEKYNDLAATRQVENRKKPMPAGNKQKFGNKQNKNRQQFQKRRETEAERLQCIQLEKARKAQLKVTI